MNINLLVFDPNSLIPTTVLQEIAASPDLTYLGVEREWEAIVHSLNGEPKPQVLMDCQGLRNALDEDKRVFQRDTQLKTILVIQNIGKPMLLYSLLDKSIQGFLTPEQLTAKELTQAVLRVAYGQIVISPQILTILLEEIGSNKGLPVSRRITSITRTSP